VHCSIWPHGLTKAVSKLLLSFFRLTTEHTDLNRWHASLRAVRRKQGVQHRRQGLPVCGLEADHWTSGTQQDAHEFLIALLAYLQVHAFSKNPLRTAV